MSNIDLIRELRHHAKENSDRLVGDRLAEAVGVLEGLEWRPIETAPKVEFAEVLLANLDLGVGCSGGWWEGIWASSDGTYISPPPTHWKPFPPVS